MRRKIVIHGLALAALAVALYAAHTIDLTGVLLSMHAPPEGAHQ